MVNMSEANAYGAFCAVFGVLLLAAVAPAYTTSVVSEKTDLDDNGEGRIWVFHAPLRSRARRVLAANSKAQKGARVPKSYLGRVTGNLATRPAAMGVVGVSPEDAMNAEEILTFTGLDSWECEKVHLAQPSGKVLTLDDGSESPEFKSLGSRFQVTRRSDNHLPFGTVGEGYKILQHSDALRVVHEITDTLNLQFEYVSVGDNGKSMTAAIMVPDEVVEFNNGEEVLQQYIAVRNTHDGKAAYTVSQFVMRLWCWNQFVATTAAAAQGKSKGNIDYSMRARIRHSSKMDEHLVAFQDIMARQAQHNKAFAAIAEELIQKTISPADMMDYWVNAAGLDQNEARIAEDGTNRWGLSTKGLNILDTFEGLRLQDQNQVGGMDGSVWQALQVYLDYLDHEYIYDTSGNINEGKADKILHSTGVGKKIKAQEAAIALLA